MKMGSQQEKAMMKNWHYNNGSFQNVQRGEYDINGKQMYFRSKWEANVSLYLDFLVNRGDIKGWKYEKRTSALTNYFEFPVDHGTTRYLPDFEIENNDGTFEYWEVKGYQQKKDLTKQRRMAKYYPEVKLLQINSDYYKDLKSKLGKVLKFY